MRYFRTDEVPEHLLCYFEPTGGGNGVSNHNTHPT